MQSTDKKYDLEYFGLGIGGLYKKTKYDVSIYKDPNVRLQGHSLLSERLNTIISSGTNVLFLDFIGECGIIYIKNKGIYTPDVATRVDAINFMKKELKFNNRFIVDSAVESVDEDNAIINQSYDFILRTKNPVINGNIKILYKNIIGYIHLDFMCKKEFNLRYKLIC